MARNELTGDKIDQIVDICNQLTTESKLTADNIEISTFE